MDELQIKLNHLKKEILPFLINNPIDVSTQQGVDAIAESLGFENEGYGFYMLEVNGEYMWNLNAVYAGSGILYCYLPITYLVEVNEEGEVYAFEYLNAYEKAIAKYNENYTRCLDTIKEILGQPMLERHFSTTTSHFKSFNNFGQQETYQYAVWQHKDHFFILQQDVLDLTPGFEDDIDFAIITNKNFREDLLPLSRLTR